MSRVIFEPDRGQRVPIRVWARSVSPEAVRQLVRIASEPYVVEHVAAMADVHVSEGVAVGTVFATEHTVVPKSLGGDLGCGMSAVRIELDADAFDRGLLESVVSNLGRAIPTGSATHRGAGVLVPDDLLSSPLSTRTLEHARSALARRHLGTLGGGNHFIELDRDADGHLWLLVHSGSRGLGASIADHHTRVAHTTGSTWLPALDTRTPSGEAYLQDVTWALLFARANRAKLVASALEVIFESVGEALEHTEIVDIHHNFVARESWFGRDLLIHRKGAISVPLGAKALIPGSMGTASYVVAGLGNEAAFGSCSHGSGRVMSRKEARAKITPHSLARAMKRVVYPEHLARDLVEEAPAAYRDVSDVLEDQEDLVTRVVRLEPIAVLKG
jgi:tRNA-splicing ligase RtcB